ncbi:MAG TPA: transferrin receptor-like dimerization domain-containing protein [Planctomycetota bacterium]
MILRSLPLAVLLSCAAPAPRPPAEDVARLEARFDALVRKENLSEWMNRLAARPHHLGSAYDKDNAEWMAAKFKDWGYETSIEESRVLFPTPKTRRLEMEGFKAALEEPALKEDATSSQKAEQLPVYNAYSIDGDVTGELVYVNTGVPKDYEELERRGIDVRGKIVIARYGGSWRGIKPKAAAERGAIGCVIYSDPREDGYAKGDVYPKGAHRAAFGAQRGSVMDMPLHPGDPLTPGWGSTPDAKRLALKDAPTLTKIPVLPISYEDALPFLRAIGGPVAPEAWQGALPLTYHLGPGPARARLNVEFDWKIVPCYSVIAKLKGRERPDSWVLRGNHHDAWVNGADDPVSGMVAVMEEARVIAELAKAGWRPRRTIVFCAWGGEEQGLLGSTEWVETHAAELKAKAVAYVNSDNNSRGFLRAQGSHSLEKLVNQVARDVVDPQTGVNVLERLRALRLTRGTAEEKKEARTRDDLRLGALGSGSDYTAFLDHLGVASLDLRYGGEGVGGSYHSIYDSIDHYTRFVDPGFAYGVALVKTAGRVVLRLAEAETLPFSFAASAEAIAGYAKEVEKLADDLRRETEEHNRLVREKRYEAAADPTRTYVAPKLQEAVPPIDFSALKAAVEKLSASAKAGGPVQESVYLTERALTRPEGLPRRPWFKHLIYAPGFYTGYGVKTLPGVREALEERDWAEARIQIAAVAEAIERYAQVLTK